MGDARAARRKAVLERLQARRSGGGRKDRLLVEEGDLRPAVSCGAAGGNVRWHVLGSVEGDFAPRALGELLQARAGHANPFGIVVSDTNSFRRLDKVVQPSDLVVEIGCSYGICTERLVKRVKHPGQVLANDIASDCTRSVQERLGGVRVVMCDVTRFYARLFLDIAEMRKEYGESSEIVLFCDIGGDRELESVVALLPFLALTLRPAAIVVKSEMLAHGAYGLGALNDQEWLQLRSISQEMIQERNASSSVSTLNHNNCKKVPQRYSPTGVPLCLFHHFNHLGGCKKKEACSRDHEHCYACGISTCHRALDCTNPIREVDLHSIFFESYASVNLNALLSPGFPAGFCKSQKPSSQPPVPPSPNPTGEPSQS